MEMLQFDGNYNYTLIYVYLRAQYPFFLLNNPQKY